MTACYCGGEGEKAPVSVSTGFSLDRIRAADVTGQFQLLPTMHCAHPGGEPPAERANVKAGGPEADT